MKKTLYLLIIFFSAGLLFWQKDQIAAKAEYVFASRCETPITYQINEVDPRFGVTKEEFGAAVFEATQIWEKPVSKDLFAESKEGELKINLIFDERQSFQQRIGDLKSQISEDKSSLESKQSEYEDLTSDFESRLAAFNEEVAYWNAKGGAPREIYNQLIEDQSELREEADNLNAIAQDLNLSINTYNLSVGELNETVKEFNDDLKVHPEEGVYLANENTINIYLNVNRDELVHTLAHELGHAVGLGHISDPDSIMYIFTSQIVAVSQKDLSELNYVCEHSSPIQTFKLKANALWGKFLETI